MLRILLDHASLTRDLRHIAVQFDAEQATHIAIRIGTFVVRFGSKAALKLIKKHIQALRQLLDFIQGNAPARTFIYWLGR